MKFHEHIKFITLDGHAYMASLWIMNEDTYQALDDDPLLLVIQGDSLKIGDIDAINIPHRSELDTGTDQHQRIIVR